MARQAAPSHIKTTRFNLPTSGAPRTHLLIHRKMLYAQRLSLCR